MPIDKSHERIDEFHNESRAAWDAAVASVTSPGAPAAIVWSGREEIIQALAPFMGNGCSHAHLPTGGGFDFLSVRPSTEPGCLEFMVTDRIVQIMKPRSLTLERINSAGNSFLLLELDDLKPSGVYETDNDADNEELLELAPADYVSRDVWEQGFLGYDENDNERAIPDSARLAVRWLKGGKVLLVAKGSLWNGDPATYDGRHNKMTAAEIRRIIEGSLTQ